MRKLIVYSVAVLLLGANLVFWLNSFESHFRPTITTGDTHND